VHLDECCHGFQVFDTSHIGLNREETVDKFTIQANTGSADETGNSSNTK
jgi:hypothetical protein